MAFRLIEVPQDFTGLFTYVNSSLGFTKDDGPVLKIKRLSLDRYKEFEAALGDSLEFKRNAEAGKGFRDRARDPRGEFKIKTNHDVRRAAEKTFLRDSLIGWERVEDAAGQPVPFSFEAFEKACGVLPDFWNFAVDSTTRLYEEALAVLADAEKN